MLSLTGECCGSVCVFPALCHSQEVLHVTTEKQQSKPGLSVVSPLAVGLVSVSRRQPSYTTSQEGSQVVGLFGVGSGLACMRVVTYLEAMVVWHV